MHVSDLDAAVQNNGRTWLAQVGVTASMQNGQPLAGARVHGWWTYENGRVEHVECMTDAQGSCTLATNEIRKRQGKVIFEVRDIVANQMVYNPQANTDPDGDTNGSEVLIHKND